MRACSNVLESIGNTPLGISGTSLINQPNQSTDNYPQLKLLRPFERHSQRLQQSCQAFLPDRLVIFSAPEPERNKKWA